MHIDVDKPVMISQYTKEENNYIKELTDIVSGIEAKAVILLRYINSMIKQLKVDS